jgi:chromosome segregation ATPase
LIYETIRGILGENPSEEDAEKLEQIAAKMAAILNQIELERTKYLELREMRDKVKERLLTIDSKITEAKAELVSTASIVDQNEKMRGEIQREEREKARIEIEKAKEKLDAERAAVRDLVQGEVKVEMDKLNEQIMSLQTRLSDTEIENADLQYQIEQLKDENGDMEKRLTDADAELDLKTEEVQ